MALVPGNTCFGSDAEGLQEASFDSPPAGGYRPFRDFVTTTSLPTTEPSGYFVAFGRAFRTIVLRESRAEGPRKVKVKVRQNFPAPQYSADSRSPLAQRLAR